MSELEELDPLDAREEDQKEVTQARQIEAMDEAAQVEQLRMILQDENVRDFLWRMLGWCKIYSSIADNNFGVMNLREGKRQVGLQLLAEICEADPTAEMKMRKKSIALAAEAKRLDQIKLLRRRARQGPQSNP